MNRKERRRQLALQKKGKIKTKPQVSESTMRACMEWQLQKMRQAEEVKVKE